MRRKGAGSCQWVEPTLVGSDYYGTLTWWLRTPKFHTNPDATTQKTYLRGTVNELYIEMANEDNDNVDTMLRTGFFPNNSGTGIINGTDRMIIVKFEIDANRSNQQTSPLHLDNTDTTIVAYYRIARYQNMGPYYSAVFLPYAEEDEFKADYGLDADGFDESWDTTAWYPGTTEATSTTNSPFYGDTGFTLQTGPVPETVTLQGNTVQPQNCWNNFDESSVSSSAFASNGRYCPHFLFGGATGKTGANEITIADTHTAGHGSELAEHGIRIRARTPFAPPTNPRNLSATPNFRTGRLTIDWNIPTGIPTNAGTLYYEIELQGRSVIGTELWTTLWRAKTDADVIDNIQILPEWLATHNVGANANNFRVEMLATTDSTPFSQDDGRPVLRSAATNRLASSGMESLEFAMDPRPSTAAVFASPTYVDIAGENTKRGTIGVTLPHSTAGYDVRYAARHGSESPWGAWVFADNACPAMPVTPCVLSYSVDHIVYSWEIRVQYRFRAYLPAFRQWSRDFTSDHDLTPPATIRPTNGTATRVAEGNFSIAWTSGAVAPQIEGWELVLAVPTPLPSSPRVDVWTEEVLNPAMRSYQLDFLADHTQHIPSDIWSFISEFKVTPILNGEPYEAFELVVQIREGTQVSPAPSQAYIRYGDLPTTGYPLSATTGLAYLDDNVIYASASGHRVEDAHLAALIPAGNIDFARNGGIVMYKDRLVSIRDRNVHAIGTSIPVDNYNFQSRLWTTSRIGLGPIRARISSVAFTIKGVTVYDDAIWLLCQAPADLPNGRNVFLMEVSTQAGARFPVGTRLLARYTGQIVFLDTDNAGLEGETVQNVQGLEYHDGEFWTGPEGSTNPSTWGGVSGDDPYLAVPFSVGNLRSFVSQSDGTSESFIALESATPRSLDSAPVLRRDLAREGISRPAGFTGDQMFITASNDRLFLRTDDASSTPPTNYIRHAFVDSRDSDRPNRLPRKTYATHPPPATVGEITVDATTRDSIELSWEHGIPVPDETSQDSTVRTEVTNNGAIADGYELQYRVAGDLGWVAAGIFPRTTTEATIVGLIPDTQYNIRLRSFNHRLTGGRVGTWRPGLGRTGRDQAEITAFTATFRGPPASMDGEPLTHPEHRCGLLFEYTREDMSITVPDSPTRFELSFNLSSQPDLTYGPYFDTSGDANRVFVWLDTPSQVPYNVPCAIDRTDGAVFLNATAQLINEEQEWESAPWTIQSVIFSAESLMRGTRSGGLEAGSGIGVARIGQPPVLSIPYLGNVTGNVEDWVLGWTRVEDAVAYQVRTITNNVWEPIARHYPDQDERFFGYFREGHGPRGIIRRSLGTHSREGLFSEASDFASQPEEHELINIDGLEYRLAALYADEDTDEFILILFGDVRAVLDQSRASVFAWYLESDISTTDEPEFAGIQQQLDPANAASIEVTGIPYNADNGGGHSQRTIIKWNALGAIAQYGDVDPRRQSTLRAYRTQFDQVTGNTADVSVIRESRPVFQARTVYDRGFVSQYSAAIRAGEDSGNLPNLFRGTRTGGFDQDDPFGVRYLLYSLGIVTDPATGSGGSEAFSLNFVLQIGVIILSAGGGALAIASTPKSGMKARVAYGLLISLGLFMGLGIGVVGIPISWVVMPMVLLLFFGFLALSRRAV